MIAHAGNHIAYHGLLRLLDLRISSAEVSERVEINDVRKSELNFETATIIVSLLAVFLQSDDYFKLPVNNPTTQRAKVFTLPEEGAGKARGVYMFLLNRSVNARHPVQIVIPSVTLYLHHVIRGSVEDFLQWSSSFVTHLVPDGPEKRTGFLLVGDFDNRVNLNIVVAEVSRRERTRLT